MKIQQKKNGGVGGRVSLGGQGYVDKELNFLKIKTKFGGGGSGQGGGGSGCGVRVHVNEELKFL